MSSYDELLELAAKFTLMASKLQVAAMANDLRMEKLTAELMNEKELRRKYKRMLKQNESDVELAAKFTRMADAASDEQATLERTEEVARLEAQRVLADTASDEQATLERTEEVARLEAPASTSQGRRYTGVTCLPNKRYKAYILQKYLGMYATEKEAADAVDTYYKSLDKIPKKGFNSYSEMD